MDEDRLIEKTQEIIKQVDQLISEAEARIAETDAFYESLGLDREAAKRYLESNKISEEERKKAKADLEAFERQLKEDIEREVTQARGTTVTSSAAKVGMKKGVIRI